jgi:hypothetical protein
VFSPVSPLCIRHWRNAWSSFSSLILYYGHFPYTSIGLFSPPFLPLHIFKFTPSVLGNGVWFWTLKKTTFDFPFLPPFGTCSFLLNFVLSPYHVYDEQTEKVLFGFVFRKVTLDLTFSSLTIGVCCLFSWIIFLGFQSTLGCGFPEWGQGENEEMKCGNERIC